MTDLNIESFKRINHMPPCLNEKYKICITDTPNNYNSKCIIGGSQHGQPKKYIRFASACLDDSVCHDITNQIKCEKNKCTVEHKKEKYSINLPSIRAIENNCDYGSFLSHFFWKHIL